MERAWRLLLILAMLLPVAWGMLMQRFGWISDSSSRQIALHAVETVDGFEFVGTGNHNSPEVIRWKREVQRVHQRPAMTGAIRLDVHEDQTGLGGWIIREDGRRRPRWEVAYRGQIEFHVYGSRGAWALPPASEAGSRITATEQREMLAWLHDNRHALMEPESDLATIQIGGALAEYLRLRPDLSHFAPLVSQGGGELVRNDPEMRSNRTIIAGGGTALILLIAAALGALSIRIHMAEMRRRTKGYASE